MGAAQRGAVLTPTRWLIAITALSLAAAGLLGVYAARQRDHIATLKNRAARASEVEALQREALNAAAQIATLTSSLSVARARLAEAEAWVPEVVERVRVRRVVVRERAQAELEQGPSQEGADASLRRLGVFREQLAERGVCDDGR